ncbi:PREDICTED: uncharacterized protein LOC106292444 [Brassica oleracea var. oleracea]|uniref:uncharacterized protein LOC106292444 n=1 Tax=Brassica oleracea var. oleracea TaxID=109376 RepID=UPI0006A6B143|nr:PREDICTED: uncharacterized protein LOC106292444 [Brassica oleracea var. oleracea]
MLSGGESVGTSSDDGDTFSFESFNLARNKLCFEDGTFSAIEIVTKSICDAREWQETLQLVPVAGLTTTISSRQAPTPQVPIDATCHVDAAWDATSGTCGLGGLFSGSHPASRLPQISESRTLVSSALMAEALAVRLAVMNAAFSNIKSLMILSDSLSLIKLLKGNESRPALFGILFDIYHFSSYFDVLSFCFIPRLQNFEADLVAKLALSHAVVIPSLAGV